jgi:hypothetical protein
MSRLTLPRLLGNVSRARVAAGAVIAMLAMAGTAAARPPESAIVSADGTFTNDFDCSFPLQETVSGSYRDTVYFDDAGNPVKEIRVSSPFGGESAGAFAWKRGLSVGLGSR